MASTASRVRTPQPLRRTEVRASGVHGKGVFALRALPAGQRIMEYRGQRIHWEEALQRHPHDPTQPHHTFYFHVDADCVIDALFQGNAARWINHACDPNCESEVRNGRVFIRALRDIAPGEELNYNYGLVLEARHTAKVKADYACRCGSPACRGTMLAPKKRRR